MIRSLAIAFAAVFLTASSAFAQKTVEEEAVGIFTQLCILSNGEPSKTAILIDPFIQAKVAGKIPVEILARSGIIAENAWFLKMKETQQELLITINKGMCALHVKVGEGPTLKKEFVHVADMYAESLKSTLKPVEEKTKDGIQFSSYAIDQKDSRVIFALSTSDKMNESGTRHLMTYSSKVSKQ